jgi:hypothetical protein
MPTYRDGDYEPRQQIRRSNRRADRSVFIVRSVFTRTYRNGETALRYAGEFWGDGFSREDDLDSRSVELMYPKIIFSNEPPPEREEDK